MANKVDSNYLISAAESDTIKLNLEDLKHLADLLLTNDILCTLNFRLLDNFVLQEALRHAKDEQMRPIYMVSDETALAVVAKTQNLKNYKLKAIPYITLIKSCLARNGIYRDLAQYKTQKNKLFSDILKNNFDLFFLTPITVSMKVIKALFKYTLGLAPLFKWLSGPLRPFARLDLPTVSTRIRRGPLTDKDGYNKFSFTSHVYQVNFFNFVLAPNLYFWSSVGKLIGAILGSVIGILLMPIAVLATVVETPAAKRSADDQITTAMIRLAELNKNIIINLYEQKDPEKITNVYLSMEKEGKKDIAENFLETLKATAKYIPDLNYYIGGIYRDQDNAQEALKYYNEVQQSDGNNYPDAMYEAGNIALHKLDDKQLAFDYFTKAKNGANVRGRKEFEADINSILDHVHADDNIIDLIILPNPTEKTPLLQEQTPVWKKKLAAENYGELRQQARAKEDNVSEVNLKDEPGKNILVLEF